MQPGILLLAAFAALAQTGEVNGYVKGPDGKAIPNAIVSFDRIDFKLHLEAKTDRKGSYQLFGIIPADYSVTVTVDGQVRDYRDRYHVSPARQDLPLTFILKPEGAQPVIPGRSGPDNQALQTAFETGKAAFLAKEFDRAIENLKKVTEMDPKQAGAWSLLADSYLGLAQQKPNETGAQYQLAKAAFSRAIEITPADAELYNAFAVALAAIQKVSEARESLAKAIQLNPPGAGKYYYNLGALLLNTGQQEAAVEALKHAIEADPGYAEAQYQYGLALAMGAKAGPDGKLVPLPGTVEALSKYLELSPAGPNVKTAKQMLALFGK